MNYCKQESKNLYKKEIKYLTDEIKSFLDELMACPFGDVFVE
jgi:hypothetical protein